MERNEWINVNANHGTHRTCTAHNSIHSTHNKVLDGTPNIMGHNMGSVTCEQFFRVYVYGSHSEGDIVICPVYKPVVSSRL